MQDFYGVLVVPDMMHIYVDAEREGEPWGRAVPEHHGRGVRRLMYILICSKSLLKEEMLSCRTSFEEHTYMSLTVKRRSL